MLTVFTRAIIIYLFLLVAMRLMGKKQLGELQPFEFAITLIAAELACIPMSDTQVPVLYGIIPIFTLFVVQFLLTQIIKHSVKMRKVINGKPVIVITPQGIDYEAINKLDMTVNDILEALRGKDYLSPSELDYAIIETNGDLSVVPKAQNKPATVGDLNLSPQPTPIPYTLICEGKRMGDNISLSGVEESVVDEILAKYNVVKKDVLLLTVAGGDDFYLQAKSQPYVIGKISEVSA